MPTATGTERSAHSNALASALAVARRGLRLRSSNCDAPIAPARRPHRAAGRLRLARPPLYAVGVTQKRGLVTMIGQAARLVRPCPRARLPKNLRFGGRDGYYGRMTLDHRALQIQYILQGEGRSTKSELEEHGN